MIARPAAVATPHELATATARQMIESGGNAFDAAVAAMLTLCVVHSHQVGIGGYGGNLVAYLAQDKKVVSIDFDSRAAPYAFRSELFANAKDRELGYKAISVPAIPAGLDLTLKTFGTRTWADVTKRAIQFADDGFVMDPTTHRFLTAWQEKTDPASRAAWFVGQNFPAIGELWVQKELGQTLRQLASDIDSFYRGELATSIVRHIHAHGGILTERDFADYQPRVVQPVTVTYRGHEVFVPPPPGGGVTTLQILKTLEHFDVGKMQHWGAEYFHLLAQAIGLCWEDRESALGDPDVVNIPIAKLLSEENAREKAKRISEAQSRPTTAPDRMNHTANVTILDREGNLVSMTATQGMVFGSQVVIPGTGLIMNHGMSRFDYDPPGHPNLPAPGKRMHHNMTPTIVLRNGAPCFACGLPGGTKIITVTAQLLVNFIDFHTTARQNIESPRMHTEPGQPLAVSHRVPQNVTDELRALGHNVVEGQKVGGPPKEIAGFANAMVIDSGKVDVASQAGADAAVVVSN